MSARLPALSYCDVGERLIFLDLHGDRYFCLAEDVERAFRASWASAASDLVSRDSCPLPHRTVFSALPAWPPALCRPPAVPAAGLWDGGLPQAGATAVMAALLVMTRVRASLAVWGLAGSLRRIEGRRCAVREKAADRDQAARLAAPFAAASRFASMRDACLPHSLAIAERLVGAGQPAQLVFGVRLGPFAAHCWVQQGALVVNDRVDVVRSFTPILVA